MESEVRRAVVSFAMPGGMVVLAAAVLLKTGILPVEAYRALAFYLFALLATGGLLALRFRSSRALYGLLVVAFANGFAWWLGTAHIPVRVAEGGRDLLALLLPVNFALLSRWRERGWNLASLTPRLTFLLAQVAAAGMYSRPEQVADAGWLRHALLPESLLGWTRLPQPALLAWVLALVVIAAVWWPKHRPMENAWFWALTASMLGVRAETTTGVSAFYFSVAALVLVLALIDTSYLLAYHDELTGIPGRRAFNEALARVEPPYAIAMVDVDHFKRFNDSYGHEAGDQVLRMVAAKLGRVGGGGRAYRCGGEEFSIVFHGLQTAEVLEHLEAVRQAIEQTRFAVRGPDRSRRRRPERRYHAPQRRGSPPHTVSVTVSVGVADSNLPSKKPAEVVNAADQALYRAKHAGRNRVEVWGARQTAQAR